MVIKGARGLGSLLACVRSIRSEWSGAHTTPPELWFRGEFRPHGLLPGFYWATNSRFRYDEEDLSERFKGRAAPYVNGAIRSEWDWYFLARHHGLPSRLLDWTESLLVAGYFALAEYFETEKGRDFAAQNAERVAPAKYDQKSPVIWILEPGSLNRFACGDDCVIAPGGELTELYLPGRVSATPPQDKNRFPLAILPAYTDARIIAQQSVFTVHGHDRTSIDGLESSSAGIKLAQIRLDRANLARLWDEIEIAGTSRAALFPDLDSVAHHVMVCGQRAR